MDIRIQRVEMEIVQGDITVQEDIEAIVNAANATLLGGGGVDGAIHRAAGPDLKKESGKLAPIGPGQAVITGGYCLPNSYVIHCVGPIYGKDKPADRLLADCYKNALYLAEEKQIQSLAFPAISTGVYGYPMGEAAEVMFETLLALIPDLQSVQKIRIVLLGQSAFKIHCKVLEKQI